MLNFTVSACGSYSGTLWIIFPVSVSGSYCRTLWIILPVSVSCSYSRALWIILSVSVSSSYSRALWIILPVSAFLFVWINSVMCPSPSLGVLLFLSSPSLSKSNSLLPFEVVGLILMDKSTINVYGNECIHLIS